MPKRILDGDAMWSSNKIRALPAWAKAEFAWLLPLAMANGVFECDRRRIWATCYAYARPEMTMDQLDQVLHAFVMVGLLFRWFEPDGKEWGYWIGIEKPGRLLPKSRIYRKEQSCGPIPPQDLLFQYVRITYGTTTKDRIGKDRIGQEESSEVLALTAPKNGDLAVDDLKQKVLSKCQDPSGIVSKTLDVIIARAQASGVKINSTQYLEKSLSNFDFEAGQDRESLMRAMKSTPL